MSPTCNALTLSIMPNPRQPKIQFEACLVGQVFFISSTAYKADHIAKNIVLLGGRTELFFSKNVTSLLVDDYYVNEFKTQYQNFSPNVVSVPEAKVNGIAKHYPVSKPQDIINLAQSAHFQSNVGIQTNYATASDISKVCNFSQSPIKNEGFAKYGGSYIGESQYGNHCQLKNESLLKLGLLSNCPPSMDQFNKYPALPYYQSDSNELKKLAMLTACTAKEGDPANFAPAPCYQSTKFIPLNAVQTFNNGISSSIATSRGYSVFLTSKAKPEKVLQEHSVFRLMQRAQQWGIAIIGICQFMQSLNMYLNGDFNKPKRRPRTTNKVNLTGCFLKVEDAARKYKAFYKILKEDPIKYLPLHNKFISRQVEIYGSAIKFVAEILNVIEGLLQGTISVTIPVIESRSKARKCPAKLEQPAKIMPKGRKKQNHFCECCNIYFSDFTHVFSDRHKMFAMNEKNYECVKDVMRTLPTLQDFLYKHSLSSETDKISLPIPVCDKTHVKNVPTEVPTNEVISALDYTKKGLCNHPVLEGNQIEVSNKPEEVNAIDFSIEKCLLFDELAALGTLTPTIDDSPIKFEFDDWMDPLCNKDLPSIFNTDDRFREFSEHCQKLLVDAKILPANDAAIPVNPGPSLNTPSLFRDSQESWKNDSNSTALNLSRFQPSLKDDTTTNCTQSITPEFSSTSQTNDQFNLSPKFPILETKISNSGTSLPKDLNEPKCSQLTDSGLPQKDTRSTSKNNRKSSVEPNEGYSTILPVEEKRMFSSDSSEGDCRRQTIISDVLTQIKSSEGEFKKARVKLTRKTESPKSKQKLKEHKTPEKPVCKRKLPSRWAVSIVPSKTIRMKFTCLPNSPVSTNNPQSSENSSIYPGEESEVL